MASDSVNNSERTTDNERLTERDEQVSQLLDDKDLRDLLIQRLQDGGHVAKKVATANETASFSTPWPPPPGQFFFPFPSMPFWGPATSPMTAGTNRPTGSTSVLDQPGSSNVQGQGGAQSQSKEQSQPEQSKDSVNDEPDEEDTIRLLDDTESLELVQFDPTVEDATTWEAGETIDSFLEKHFSRIISAEERDSIMGDFPRPSCAVLRTPKLDEEVKKLIKQAGKDPHFGTEKALYKLQDQILDLAGPLTCLWADLLSKDAKVKTEDVILLLQRVLVLLGSASHTITQERRRVAWARASPASTSTPPEDTDKGKEPTLFRGGFLEKATKRMEEEKALAKVSGGRHSGGAPPAKRRRPDQDPNDLRRFLEKGAPAKYGGRNQRRQQPYFQRRQT